jgi:hypothetical protein
MKRTVELISYALAIATVLGGCSTTSEDDVVSAEQAALSVTSGSVTATLETTSSWSGGFCQSVTLKNTGTAISSWTLTVATNGATISSIWGANQTTSGKTMTVTPASYNAHVATGGSINFGYCGAGNVLPTLSSITVTGGTTGTGGAPGTGGSSAKGGSSATGGSSAKGGSSATGGSSAKGGSNATGGTPTTIPTPGNYPLGNAAVRSSGCGKTPTLTSGPKTLGSRKYIIRLPDNYDKNKPYKLVFGMHWMGGTMEDVDTGRTVTTNVWSYYGLKQLDTAKEVIFVAPNANGSIWSKSDETFVDDMVNLFKQDLCIDQSRIFSVGFSFGAIFSYSLACDRPNIFRAVATQAPAQNLGCNNGSTPVGYFSVVGMTDGVCTPSMGRACRDTFATRNGCTKPSAVPEWTSGNHVCYKYQGCKAGYPVEYCTAGHPHIAAPWDGGGGDSGTKTWVPLEIWKFFSQF